MKPKRIQRKRTAGWRMPENAVYVGRPSVYGNPFRVPVTEERDARACVIAFNAWLTVEGCTAGIPEQKQALLDGLPALRGKDLACWCALDQPCHADVLLEMANDE